MSLTDVSNNAYLQLPQTDPQDVVDSLREPTFFKAVVPVEDKEVLDKLLAAETQRIETRRKQFGEVSAEIQKLSEKELRGPLDPAERATLERDQQIRDEAAPNWLLFDSEPAAEDAGRPAAELAEPHPAESRVAVRQSSAVSGRARYRPRSGRAVHQRHVFQLERLAAAECRLADRPDHAGSDAKRRCRGRNVDTSAKLVMVPIRPALRNEPFVLVRPDGKRQPVEVERRGTDSVWSGGEGFWPNAGRFIASSWCRRTDCRRLAASKAASGDAAKSGNATASNARKHREQAELIAANGPAEESNLTSIDAAGLAQRMTEPGSDAPLRYHWVARGDPISLSGAEVWGEQTWWWLVLAVLLCLFLELAILAWPAAMARSRQSKTVPRDDTPRPVVAVAAGKAD